MDLLDIKLRGVKTNFEIKHLNDIAVINLPKAVQLAQNVLLFCLKSHFYFSVNRAFPIANLFAI